ncbi:DivIVA domain-containing protein [Brachybacterium sp. DNPG3]
MALMPDDLLNKRFTPVRFSEGYDMDEVDNYLDNDILPRLQELIDENNRLTDELERSQNRVAQLEREAEEARNAEPPAAAAAEPVVEEAPPVEEPVVEAAPEPEPAPEPVAAPAAAAPADDQSAAGIIALANRLHDEYVKAGEDERDRLITEANDEHQRIVGEAEEKSRSTLEALEESKAALEKSIDKLRTFERDYRSRLRNYLENQLRDLDTTETQDKQANFGL